ncbi:NmrA family transcriptional regulator [Amycolatopsis thailandensis]|uniref:NmrA family transcriptional regulator n=1 Tax=Amycolatopsis thailandensis TaxID=589330 RepID=A0A229RP49_9PSEU|nr:NAD(P)H-binding protein [Amycolatopsis thailandensis]OXM48433.1 NmrA family transcriptional regulator [Amycolatopsis thailandensis]
MIVVTGATGNVGRRLVETLAAEGEEVTAVSRRISPADVPAGVWTVQADLAKADGLKEVFAGADRVFLLTSGEFMAAGGDVAEVVAAAGEAAIVLLSSQGVGSGRHASVFEEAVKASSPEWTVLRPGGFASNAFQWAPAIRDDRVVAAPFGDVALPVIDPADIADVAAAVLRGSGHHGRTYVLTGPEPVSPRQQAAALGDALGEPVRFAELSEDEARAAMSEFMPPVVVEATLAILGRPTEDERRVSPDVERLLGRPGRTFAEWAARNAAAFK